MSAGPIVTRQNRPAFLQAVKITTLTLPVASALTNNGSSVMVGQLVSAMDIGNNKLVFTPAANASGAGYASFTFKVQDNGGMANGGVDLADFAISATSYGCL